MAWQGRAWHGREAFVGRQAAILGGGESATALRYLLHDASLFITGGAGSAVRGPGPKKAGPQWLSRHGIFAAGSDTVGFEHLPSHMEVHVHLLVEKGIHIIECLNLESLSEAGLKEFLFVALPLKIRGGTGSPIRPVALSEI